MFKGWRRLCGNACDATRDGRIREIELNEVHPDDCSNREKF